MVCDNKPQHSGMFAVIIISALMLAISACTDSDSPPQDSSSPALSVSVAKAQTKKVPIYAEAIGNTQAVETVEIRSRVDGYLLQRDFKDGSLVSKGELLFVIDPDQYEQDMLKNRVQLEYAKASLELARKETSRYGNLLEKQLVSQEEYDLRLLKEQEAQANVLVSRANVNLAQIQINHTRISSPVDGIIGLSQIDRGGLVSAGSTLLAEISTIDPIYFFFSMSEEDYIRFASHYGEGLQEILKDMEVKLTLAGELEYPQTGHLDMFDRAVDPRTGSIAARAVFPNPEGDLRPGMFGRARVTVEKQVEALFVPQEAIMDTLGHKSVFVVDQKGQVASRTVKLGGRHENLRAIQDGLSAGEMVATGNLLKLRPGMQVKPELKTKNSQ